MHTRALFGVFSFVLLWFARPLMAEDEPYRSITVTGSAQTAVEPDGVLVEVGISTHDETAAKAKAANDVTSKRVFGLAEEFNIKAEDVKTTSVRLDPIRRRKSFRPYEIVGYDFEVEISFRLTDLSQLESFVDRVAKSGANSVYIGRFQSSQYEKLRAETRLKAVKAAHAKATALAEALGMKIGKPSRISEDSSLLGGMGGGQFEDFDEDDEGITYAHGKIVITAEVEVVFDLEAASQ